MKEDSMQNTEYIINYFKDAHEVIDRFDHVSIDKAIEILFEAWKKGKRVYTVGNGGSAAAASHFAGDLAKTVSNDSSFKDISTNKGFRAFCLNDNQAALTAWINDCGWDKAYSGLLHTFLEQDDVLLLISVHGGSGWSGNLVEAMKLAKERGAKMVGLSGFDGGKMKEMCDACIVVPAHSTPHVEAFHCVLQHLIIFRLLEKIKEHGAQHG